MLNLAKMYLEDEEFREYVDKCSQTRHLGVDAVLDLHMTRNYVEYLVQSREDKINEVQ